MPMYEYHCATCGKSFEIIQRFSDAPLTRCEACGGALTRPIQPAGFQLKGGGWYADGYASAGAKPEAKEAGKTAEGSSKPAGDSGKSEGSKSEDGKSESSKSDTKAASATTSSTTVAPASTKPSEPKT